MVYIWIAKFSNLSSQKFLLFIIYLDFKDLPINFIYCLITKRTGPNGSIGTKRTGPFVPKEQLFSHKLNCLHNPKLTIFICQTTLHISNIRLSYWRITTKFISPGSGITLLSIGDPFCIPWQNFINFSLSLNIIFWTISTLGSLYFGLVLYPQLF